MKEASGGGGGGGGSSSDASSQGGGSGIRLKLGGFSGRNSRKGKCLSICFLSNGTLISGIDEAGNNILEFISDNS